MQRQPKEAKDVEIRYSTGSLTDLKAMFGAGHQAKHIQMKLGKETYKTSPRFWHSLCSQFQISPKVFNLFTPAEVFERLLKNPKFRATADGLRFCMEINGKSQRLLAVSADGKAHTLKYSRVADLLRNKGGENLKYHDGMLTCRFQPPSGEAAYKLGPDEFKNRLMCAVPVDGYGESSFYLELLRLICDNGNVAMTPSFRSTIKHGKDPYYAINRAIESYDNDSGFAQLQARIQLAQASKASVNEAMSLGALIHKRESCGKFLGQFNQTTGDLCAMLGVTNLEAIPVKKRVLLPTKARVYDLINFATELATHKASTADARVLNGWVGRLLATPYDLENTGAEKIPKFQAFLTA